MDQWGCSSCRGQNPLGMLFCGHCGERDAEDRAGVDGAWSCRSCASLNGHVMTFCGRCGQRRGEQRHDDLRFVTSLFADISGFTTLADQLEAEDLHAIINPLIGGLARIAERYGGFVAKYAGDALLCLFGAPIAHEDDAQRALLAALEMQASLPTLLATLDPMARDLTIHVGVNTGKVVAGAVGSVAQADYSVLGDAVILAQRLESVCPSGQTYVGASTQELCKDEFDFEDVGELQLKGKLNVVRAFRLVGRRRAGTDVGRPLVGREDELSTVMATLQQRGTVVISGEPGVGKSRLLAEARLRLTGEGMLWLPMRCLSYGGSLPYWPFVDLLRQALGLRVEDPVEDVMERLGSTLPSEAVAGAARLLGLESEALPPEQARRQVHDAMASMLGVLSGGRPLTLAVEDVHWIDTASAELLAELVRQRDFPLSALLSTREEGLATAEAVAQETSTRVTLRLAPLSQEALRDLAADVLGGPIAAGLADLLLVRTHGNPLYVEQLARALHEQGGLVETVAGFDLPPGFNVEGVPETVERVLAARVDSLSLPATAVLMLAATVGRVVRLSLLQAVADARATDLGALGELVDGGFLDRVVEQDEPAIAFHHALLQDVVYGRLLKRQRRDLHRSVADAGLALYGDSDETVDLLARHLYLAEAGEDAAVALLRAGRRAARMFANGAAVEHLRHALDVLAPEDDRVRTVTRELAGLQQVHGDYDAAEQLYRGLVLEETVASDWSGLATVLRKTGRYDEALHLLADGLARMPGEISLILEQARAALLSGRPVEALTSVRHGLSSLAEDDDRGRALLLVELVHIEDDIGHPEFAAAHGKRAVALLQRLDLPMSLVTAQRMLGLSLAKTDHLEQSALVLSEAISLAQRIGHVEEAAGALLNLGMVHSAQGLGDLAVQSFERAAAEFDRLGHASGRAIAYGNLADALLGTGRAEEALTWAHRSHELAQGIGNARQVAFAIVTTAEIQVALKRTESALVLVEQARQMFVEMAAEDMVDYCDRVTQGAVRIA